MGSSKMPYKSLRQYFGANSRVAFGEKDAEYNEENCEDFRADGCGDQRSDRPLRLYRCISILNTCLLVVLISLLAFHMVQARKVDDAEPFITRAYGSNKPYMTLDHEYDSLWVDPATTKAGVISVSKNDIGAISMFHQLHCLASLRTALQNAREGGKVAFDYREDKHWPHCLDYLRQMVLCKADSQIEAGQIWKVGRPPVVDGSNDMRKCRDPNVLYQLYDERKAA